MTKARVDEQAPLRAELFSADQMEQHGRYLAGIHALSHARLPDRLLKRLDDNERTLTDTRSLLTAAVRLKIRIAPAGEWLIDNFYLIEEQIRTARRHLPSGYSREIPRLATGPSSGLPRIYDLALEAISHGDGRIDSESLVRFVAAYQTVVPLTLGELWAIPIMLRLALIENLRRVGMRIMADSHRRSQAHDWANRMMEIAERDPKDLILVIADMARSDPPLVGAFVAELTRRLQGHGPALAMPLTWIEQRLAESSLTIDQMVLSENQQQAADQVSISNSINSLRFLGAMDWHTFVESMSLVEKVLREDGDGKTCIYRDMDFATRDGYRHVVARLAKRSRLSEVEVARCAIALARRAELRTQGLEYRRHVGYYLIDRGLPELERAVSFRVPLSVRVRRAIGRHPLALHLGAILLITAPLVLGIVLQSRASEVGTGMLWLLSALALVAASQLASALVNWASTLLTTPRRLPRMDYARGVPSEMRTLVVIPTLLGCAAEVEDLIEALEVRFLGNRDTQVFFALLTDFPDAQKETLASDEALVRQAQQAITVLNRKYQGRGSDRFFLLHRPRRWNPLDRLWMGYERKRGKLADLNAALRGDGFERFSVTAGDVALLKNVRYVITLDTDTLLPRDSARQLIGAMAHPLNRPHYDPLRQRVARGYGILQPRVVATLSQVNRSRYTQLFGGEAGIDPYTRSASDVYQDVFEQGSFIGKGIYDVDAFEQSLRGRFPENRILSHDLLEGCYARSGLLSDVHLFESYPDSYLAEVKRQRRWIRGDWQIAAWLLPWVPSADGGHVRNPLSTLSRWKVFDNLRRCGVAGALVLLLLLGWSQAHAAAWFWTLVVAVVVFVPPLLMCLVAAIRKPDDITVHQHLANVLHAGGRDLAQAAFRVACLPFEAQFSLGAALTASWRMRVTRRGLLEWQRSVNPGLHDTAIAASEPGSGQGDRSLASAYRSMCVAPLTAVVAGALVAVSAPGAWAAASPVLLLWLAAPGFAWWLGRPLAREDVRLSAEQSVFLRKLARKTWAFFDRFASADDHWLPPDNFQEHPSPVIAHRTSPTNIGLALLANLSASDFGFITAAGLMERTANTFGTLSRLPRYQGHFYNWYDTRSLQPLQPRYVSSVDSGNLAGHLLTLGVALESLPEQPIVSPRLFEGLLDTYAVLADLVPAEQQAPLADLHTQLLALCAQPANTLAQVLAGLDRLAHGAGALVAGQVTFEAQASMWLDTLVRQMAEATDDLLLLAPWLNLPAAPAGFGHRIDMPGIPSLRALATRALALAADTDGAPQSSPDADGARWLSQLRGRLAQGAQEAKLRIDRCAALALDATEFASMEYEFLYDRTRHLLAIGYNVDESRRDLSFYDLLASEARLCSFVAIAQGKLPQESWFGLGRLLAMVGGRPILLSWSGSMFEYLMPLLVMPAYAGTLLDQTYRAAVQRQIAYGQQRGVPWGVSESGYAAVDASLNYQYRAFGVPGLGLKRGLTEDLVVTPYASALALMVAPEAACENLRRLSAEGMEGRFGYYEASDYTPDRVPPGQTRVVVRSFMAHHQGMILLSLAYALLDRPMQRRFESAPLFQATLPLLHERIPNASAFYKRDAQDPETAALFDVALSPAQASMGADTPAPEVQLLSNGRYHVMVSNAGGGYSRWRDLAVTRWREDSTCDNWGTFLYLRDATHGQIWSAAHQPTLKRAERYEAVFTECRAEYRRRDHEYETYSEIVVSPEDDIELRRIRVTNHARVSRVIEITSYAEVVLATPAADAMQPSFGNLFVQTEIIDARRAILCTRRPRSVGEATPWMFHLMATNGTRLESVSYETDRMRFIGRGRSLVEPRAMVERGALSGTAGSVLDPIVAIRCRLHLDAGQSATIDWVSGMADSREACMALVEKYQDRHLADRVFDLAWTHGGVTLRQINAAEADAQLYRRLAGAVLYAHRALRADGAVLMQNRRGQSGLWGYAISGDLPIVLLKISDLEHLELARQMIRCHAYWRMKGLAVDLVIWNEDHAGYRQHLQDQIMALIAHGSEAQTIDRPGGIFVRYAEQISNEDRILLQSAARAIVSDRDGSLADQLGRRAIASPRGARLLTTRVHRAEPAADGDVTSPELLLANAFGGFTPDGTEYVITTTQSQLTPMPWVNVLANPGFGTLVSESGLSYTWSENAHEFRLTPWRDDPVGAAGGEAIYLRDEESGHYWSPTAQPSRGAMPYRTRHGFGYSAFEHTSGGVHSALWVYVDLEAAVKFSVLKVRNGSGRTRRLSATGYVEWVLGDLRPKSAMHVITEIDATSGALFARNAYNSDFGGRVAFFDVDDTSRTLTGDRTEFIGRNGSLASPDAMLRARLSGRLGAGLDPCGALQVPFELADGQEREIIFRLGAGQDHAQACALAQRLRQPGSARTALERVRAYWAQTLGTVQIKTPDPALDVLANGWLVYQTLACRMWGRSGFYQSGGAFGFRDQLQDSMALVHAEPQRVREHLLRCAARQYPEGDVQHWWHPPSGRGVRTRCSDDYLWLPLAICRYVRTTGDIAVLEQNVGFLEGRALGPDEESHYDQPGRASELASLYQHGVRAIVHGLRFGAHGLPLMGSGDWNDGMNRVGIHGKGESVWLGFFLYEVLTAFAALARRQGDAPFAERCLSEARVLQANLERHAWDGRWYRRAWFDDGTPLGSAVNQECSIDSISQSWSVLSGAGTPSRCHIAMDSLDQHLVHRDSGVVQLLDPPFDRSAMDPGYIKGYVPGVRENGGQYTHAAIWAAMAFAAQDDRERAWELVDLINPLKRCRSAEDIAIYKTEPYVLAADVYGRAPHTGRGGWTWYTGSAGWMYRLIVESLLGLRREGDRLYLQPCMPANWDSFEMQYRFGRTWYRITVVKALAASRLQLDGLEQRSGFVALLDDGQAHAVELRWCGVPVAEGERPRVAA